MKKLIAYQSWFILIAIAALILFTAGCGGGGSEFTYRVGGTAPEAIVKYINAEGETEKATVSLPWEKTFTVGEKFSFKLEVVNKSGTGTVTCEALVDGDSLGKGEGESSVSCYGDFRKKGKEISASFSWVANAIKPATPTPQAPSAEDHIEKGIEYARQGKLDEAVAEFKEAIRLEPDNAKAHYNLGLVYDKQGQFDQAIAEYKEAIRLDPNHVPARNNLGGIYYNQKRFDEAAAEFKEVIRIKPDYALAHRNLGALYATLGKNSEAIAEFETYLKLRPDAPDKAKVEGWIAQLQKTAVELKAEHENALGGYSIRYPEGWFYSDKNANIVLSDSKEALDASLQVALKTSPLVIFSPGSASEIANTISATKADDPVLLLNGLNQLYKTATEAEPLKVDGNPAAIAYIADSFDGTPWEGCHIIILTGGDKAMYGTAMAPPDRWDALQPILEAMLKSVVITK
ncbi:MAG TPA: tetratricopeptide repeat protein [Chloroflexi bacterium]|nr:tetratricopeptide repeat protein [Chloroflexota bacterium]